MKARRGKQIARRSLNEKNKVKKKMKGMDVGNGAKL